jgi:hypothetical protein
MQRPKTKKKLLIQDVLDGAKVEVWKSNTTIIWTPTFEL